MRAPLYFSLAKRMIRCDVPYKYTFDLTYRCNSRCKTCNIWRGKKAKKGEIKLWEFKRVLEKVSGDVLWMTLSGGEPTMRPDFHEFIAEGSKTCPNLRLINVAVNGLLPGKTEEMFRKALERMDRKVGILATVSMDGYGSVHDRVRGRKGSWKKASSTLKRLRKLEKEYRNFNVGVQTTISRYNIRSVPRFLERMADYPHFLTFAHDVYLFQNRGKELIKTGEDFERLMGEIRKRQKQKGATGLASRMYMKLASQHFMGNGDMVLPCTATKASLTIDPYLNVQACVSMGFPLGNLRKNGYDIPAVLESERCADMRELIKNAQCCKCWMPCEAYPTIMHNLPKAIGKCIRGK